MNEDFKSIEHALSLLCEVHKADKVFILTDSNVAPLVSDLLPGVPRLVVEAGEDSKSLDGARKVWCFLEKNKAIRRSVLINIGGGMVSDLGGFAASTFKRGIGYINLPTTLLAAVDASIGGKTGVNFAGLKNEIGVFALPLGVFPIVSLFESLSSQEWLSGVGEAIKAGLLDSEELYLLATSKSFIEERNPEVVAEVVKRCAAFKSYVVKDDFKEKGKRKILNLGHTAGHAIEEWMMSRGEYIPHGVAVAHGLRISLEKSCDIVGLDERVLVEYTDVLSQYFPPLEISSSQWEEVAAFMARDKKSERVGKPSWVLLESIGRPIVWNP